MLCCIQCCQEKWHHERQRQIWGLGELSFDYIFLVYKKISCLLWLLLCLFFISHIGYIISSIKCPSLIPDFIRCLLYTKRVLINYEGKHHYIGGFGNYEEAALAYGRVGEALKRKATKPATPTDVAKMFQQFRYAA